MIMHAMLDSIEQMSKDLKRLKTYVVKHEASFEFLTNTQAFQLRQIRTLEAFKEQHQQFLIANNAYIFCSVRTLREKARRLNIPEYQSLGKSVLVPMLENISESNRIKSNKVPITSGA